MSDTFTARKLSWLEQIAKDAGLPPSATRVGVLLSSYLNRETDDAWPSIDRICAELGMSDRGVQKAIKSLIERGHIERKTGGGRASTNRYSILCTGDKQGTHVRLNPERTFA